MVLFIWITVIIHGDILYIVSSLLLTVCFLMNSKKSYILTLNVIFRLIFLQLLLKFGILAFFLKISLGIILQTCPIFKISLKIKNTKNLIIFCDFPFILFYFVLKLESSQSKFIANLLHTLYIATYRNLEIFF